MYIVYIYMSLIIIHFNFTKRTRPAAWDDISTRKFMYNIFSVWGWPTKKKNEILKTKNMSVDTKDLLQIKNETSSTRMQIKKKK